MEDCFSRKLTNSHFLVYKSTLLAHHGIQTLVVIYLHESALMTHTI